MHFLQKSVLLFLSLSSYCYTSSLASPQDARRPRIHRDVSFNNNNNNNNDNHIHDLSSHVLEEIARHLPNIKDRTVFYYSTKQLANTKLSQRSTQAAQEITNACQQPSHAYFFPHLFKNTPSSSTTWEIAIATPEDLRCHSTILSYFDLFTHIQSISIGRFTIEPHYVDDFVSIFTNALRSRPTTKQLTIHRPVSDIFELKLLKALQSTRHQIQTLHVSDPQNMTMPAIEFWTHFATLIPNGRLSLELGQCPEMESFQPVMYAISTFSNPDSLVSMRLAKGSHTRYDGRCTTLLTVLADVVLRNPRIRTIELDFERHIANTINNNNNNVQDRGESSLGLANLFCANHVQHLTMPQVSLLRDPRSIALLSFCLNQRKSPLLSLHLTDLNQDTGCSERTTSSKLWDHFNTFIKHLDTFSNRIHHGINQLSLTLGCAGQIDYNPITGDHRNNYAQFLSFLNTTRNSLSSLDITFLLPEPLTRDGTKFASQPTLRNKFTCQRNIQIATNSILQLLSTEHFPKLTELSLRNFDRVLYPFEQSFTDALAKVVSNNRKSMTTVKLHEPFPTGFHPFHDPELPEFCERVVKAVTETPGAQVKKLGLWSFAFVKDMGVRQRIMDAAWAKMLEFV